jgi:hypothetical protein
MIAIGPLHISAIGPFHELQPHPYQADMGVVMDLVWCQQANACSEILQQPTQGAVLSNRATSQHTQ